MSVSHRYREVIAEDASALHARLASSEQRILVLWGHPQVGRADLVAAAATAAGRPFRQLEARQLESWDGLRDVTESGQFKTISIESFLAGGDPVDPTSYDLRPGEVLYLRGLNRAPSTILEAVFRPVLEHRKLLNNPLPNDVQIVAGALPTAADDAQFLLGDLFPIWSAIDDRSELDYKAHPLPGVLQQSSDHWGVLPSVARFAQAGQRMGLAEEVVGFIEDELLIDPVRAAKNLFAAIVCASDPFNSTSSPAGFSDLGALLAERRMYFASRQMKRVLAQSKRFEDVAAWLRATMTSWEPDRWIEAGAWNMLHGESVSGGEWLRNLCKEVATGRSSVALDDIANYAALERRSLQPWAMQELGDDVGAWFVERATVGPGDLEHLRAAGVPDDIT